MTHPTVRRFRERRARRAKVAAISTSRSGPPPDDSFWWGPAFLQQLGGGEIREPFKTHPWVFRAVSVLVDNLVSLPLKVYAGDKSEPTEQENTDWTRLLIDPNPEQDALTFWTLTWAYQLLPPGECFWILEGSGKLGEGTVPRYATPVSGKFFEPKVNGAGSLIGWTMKPPAGQPVDYELHEVVQHRCYPNPYDPRRGVCPLDAAARSVRTDQKAHLWNEASLDNGAEPGGILTTDPANPHLTDDQASQIRRQFEDRHGGAGNARKLAVLGGGLKWQQTGMSPKDMEFEGQRRWSRQEVASAYGVPLMLLGDMSEIHSKESARTVLKLFWENTLIPLLRRAEATLEHDLFMGRGGNGRAPENRGLWAAWDVSAVKALQQDEHERREMAKAEWGMGVPLSAINERHNLGYEDIDGAETPFVPAGVQPVEFALEPPQPPPDFTPKDDEEEDEDPPIPDEDEEEEKGTVVAVVRNADRLRLWHQYIRGIQAPGEKKMRSRILRWMRLVRKDTLAWLGGQRSIRDVTDGDLHAFLTEYQAKWDRYIVETTQPVTEWITAVSLDRLEKQLGGLERASMTHPDVIGFMDEMGARKIKHISRTMQRQIRGTLMEGLAEGENVTSLQDRIRHVSKVSNARSLTIARTESGAASTGSRWKGYQIEGVDEHTWISAGDEATRASHIAQDGVTVVVGERFPNGLLYPLDSDGAPGEVINCRCDTVPK